MLYVQYEIRKNIKLHTGRHKVIAYSIGKSPRLREHVTRTFLRLPYQFTITHNNNAEQTNLVHSATTLHLSHAPITKGLNNSIVELYSSVVLTLHR